MCDEGNGIGDEGGDWNEGGKQFKGKVKWGNEIGGDLVKRGVFVEDKMNENDEEEWRWCEKWRGFVPLELEYEHRGDMG